MKWLFYSFIILLAAVMLGLLAYQDPGYVLIGRGKTTLEMSLSLFTTIIVLGFLLLYAGIRLIFRAWRTPAKIRKWRKLHRSIKARRASNYGLIELAEGHWHEAERALLKNVKDSETPLLNYLSAARAAQKQHAHERRDHYLAMAHQSTPGADMAVELTQAELQMAHGQYEQALATLMHLQTLSPRHPHVLYLLMQLYEKLHSWGDLKELLPRLEKQGIIDKQAHQDLSRKVYLNLLRLNAQNADNLERTWQQIPRALRHDNELLQRYVRSLLDLNQFDTAEGTLREAIKKDWNTELVRLYGLIPASQPDRQLQQAEHWLKGREQNAVLLLTLGRLAIKNKLWGKARSYLEASLGNSESPETYKELGQLLETLDERDAAAACFRKGLLLTA